MTHAERQIIYWLKKWRAAGLVMSKEIYQGLYRNFKRASEADQ